MQDIKSKVDRALLSSDNALIISNFGNVRLIGNIDNPKLTSRHNLDVRCHFNPHYRVHNKLLFWRKNSPFNPNGEDESRSVRISLSARMLVCSYACMPI